MLAATEGIVLHSIKYGENSLIVTVYTRKFGRQSYILNAARSKKSKNKSGIFQPLFLVDLVTYQKQSREIQRIKEVKNTPVYQDIPFNMLKTAQVIFLAEMLGKTLHEEESSEAMFDFLQNSLLYFDLMTENSSNFHLYLLLKLTSFLGFMPDVQYNSFEGWFDLKKGKIVPFEPPHPFFMHKEATASFAGLAQQSLTGLSNWRIPGRIRDYLLDKMVEYYQFHFQNLGEIKSLKVLKEVFS